MRYAVRLIFVASIVLSLLIFVKILLTFTPVPELFNRGIETWQIILFCITLSLSFFAYLTLNPPIIRADNKTEGRRELPPDSLNDSDFLLVVSKEISAGEAKDFSENNPPIPPFSNPPSPPFNKGGLGGIKGGFFWINILEKEIGYFSMVDVSKLDKEVIKDKRVIIFSKGTTEKLTEERKNILKEFLKKGGILLIEIPDSSISELTGIALSDKSEFARKIDWIEPELLSVSGIRSSDFNSMPLNTTIHSIEHKEHDVKTILKIDGKDAILERKVETGKVIILCFDLSFQIFSMKQGIPAANDYRVSIGLNKEIRGVQTSNMAINKEMKINLIPFADILERFIMDITLQDSNIPVWWYYPHKFKGASIISFDEDFYGDRLFDTVQSLELRVKSKSHFIMSDSKISAGTIEKLIRSGDEVGIHWNRFYLHVNRFGLHYAKNKSLKEQINHLSSKLKVQSSKLKIPCRIHYLRWGNDYTDAFEIMNSANIYMDSSYGPGRDEWGYVFGTGFPFQPLDKNGIPFNLYEFPFHCHEPYGNIGDSHFNKLIDESVNTFNMTIVYLFHPYHCKKDGVSYERMLKAMDNMNGRRWVTNFKEYMSFYEARKKSSIKSTRLDNKIYIEADVKQNGMGISLRHFQKIKDIQPSAFSPLEKTGLISLPKGKHRIEIAVQ